MMYKFWGKVRIHNKRGRQLGFPTANVDLHKKPAEGVYISKTKIDHFLYSSLTFIGAAKTFGESKFHAETYILDFDQNIYDKWISVKLLKKIRSNKKFNSVEELISQMKKDEIMARDYMTKKIFLTT